MLQQSEEQSAQIKEFAVAQGADLVGIAPVETYVGYGSQVDDRIRETEATRRDFMIRDHDVAFFDRLSSAANTLPSARAIVVIGVYAYDESAVYRRTGEELRGKIARTYRYYPAVRQVAESVVALIQDLGYSATCGQDVPLKYVAQRIGLGGYGKNSLLLTKEYGSYVGLRAVITEAPLKPDAFKRASFCQDCDRCLKACPTGALYAPYKVDPRLCLNPITRRQAPIAPGVRLVMQNWICGCDICQEVCPVNQGLPLRKTDPRSGFDPRHHASHRDLGGLDSSPRLLDLLGDDNPWVIRRNAAIALANVGRGRTEVIAALDAQVAGADDELRDYLRWAIEVLSAG